MGQFNNAFILIPDISGFSKFVQETEVKHSQHIISELLQIIIDSNQLKLRISEVEGDAVIFYSERIPSQNELISQIELMFKSFHRHLNQYNSYRICSCGACSSASNLSLKFIAHIGELGFIKTLGREKPHGHAMVFAHRLLKTGLDLSEYIVISEELKSKYADEDWKQSENYFELEGIKKFYYKNLEILLAEIPDPIVQKSPDRIKKPISRSIKIRAEIDDVIEHIIDFSLRIKWQTGVKRFEYSNEEINRVGSEHLCIIQNGSLNIQTIQSKINYNYRIIGEKTSNPPFFKSVIFYFILEMEEELVKVSTELHYFQKNLVSRFVTPFFKMKAAENMQKSLENLKKIVEDNDE